MGEESKEEKAGLVWRMLSYVFPRSFERAVKNSDCYIELKIETDVARKSSKRMLGEIAEQRSQIGVLENKVEGAEAEAKIFREQVLEEKRKADDSESRYISLKQYIPRIVNLVGEAKKVCVNVRTAQDAIIARAEANRGSNAHYNRWEESIGRKLAERTKAAEETARTLVGGAFCTAMRVAFINNPRTKKIPFVYYDFVNKNIVYTDGAIKLLRLDDREILDDDKKKISLMQMLRYIQSSDLTDKEGIIPALRTGRKLEHYEVMTSGENPRKLSLTTYPVFYRDEKMIHPIGVGILLYDTKSWIGRPRGTGRFADSIDSIMREMMEEYNRNTPYNDKKYAI